MAQTISKPVTTRARVIWTAISVPVATIASVIGCFALAALAQQYFFSPQAPGYGYAFNDPHFFDLSMIENRTILAVVPYVIAAGFWLALRRLPRLSWWRAMVLIAVQNAALIFVIMPLSITLLYALYPIELSPTGSFVVDNTPTTFGANWSILAYYPLAIAVFFAVGIILAGVSVGLARLFARWRFVSAERQQTSLWRDLLLIGGVNILLTAIQPTLFATISRWIESSFDYTSPLFAPIYIAIALIIYLAPAIIMTVIASIHGWRALRQLAPVALFKPSPMPPSSDDVVFTYGAIGGDE